MDDTNPAMTRLDAAHNTNWNIDAGPVAVLNPASTLHERIAYCWGVADQLFDLAQILNEHESREVATVAGLFFCHLHPLVALLDRLGADTRTPCDAANNSARPALPPRPA